MEIRCLEDVDAAASVISDPDEELAQDNFHRLVTPPGQNIDDPGFGLGIDRLLSGDDHDLASLASRIEAELRKDRRNAEVRALVTPEETRGEYRIAIAIVKDDGEILEQALRATAAGLEVL